MAVRALLLLLIAPVAQASIVIGDQWTAYGATECRGKRPAMRPAARPRGPELICAQWAEDRCLSRRVQMQWRAE